MDRWNDDRLDELSRRMDAGFAKVDKRFECVEREMREGFAQTATKGELGEVTGQLREVGNKLDRLVYGAIISVLGIVLTHAL